MGIVKCCVVLTVRLIIPEIHNPRAGQAKRVLLVNKFPTEIEV